MDIIDLPKDKAEFEKYIMLAQGQPVFFHYEKLKAVLISPDILDEFIDEISSLKPKNIVLEPVIQTKIEPNPVKLTGSFNFELSDESNLENIESENSSDDNEVVQDNSKNPVKEDVSHKVESLAQTLEAGGSEENSHTSVGKADEKSLKNSKEQAIENSVERPFEYDKNSVFRELTDEELTDPVLMAKNVQAYIDVAINPLLSSRYVNTADQIEIFENYSAVIEEDDKPLIVRKDKMEKRKISSMLKKANGDKEIVAQKLGLSLTALIYKMQILEIKHAESDKHN